MHAGAPRFKNLAGETFGLLAVLALAARRASSGDRYWVCRCQCGRTVEASGSNLKRGAVRSCRNHARPAAVVDLRGRRFGRLLAVEVAGRDRQGRATWSCVCDCGAAKVVPSRHLVGGNVMSCGCYQQEVRAANGGKGAWKISGPASHLFKPHLTAEDRAGVRDRPELRAWRKEVFARDDYTCRLCGSRGGRLEAHHLFCWAGHPSLRFDVGNGLTLCRGHHKAFHAAMGGERAPCVAADFDKFAAAWYLRHEIERLKREGGV